MLKGEAALTDAMQEVEISKRGPTTVTLLRAGSRPSNPSELLASRRMEQVLTELRSTFDLVVIDTSPALSVPDPIPLFSLASGVILVAKMHSTSKDSLVRLQRLVRASGGNVLGVVPTGMSGHAIGEYYGYTSRYGYRYGYGKHAAGYYVNADANGNGHDQSLGRIFGKRDHRKAEGEQVEADEEVGSPPVAD